MGGRYRFLAYDLRTNTAIAELPLANPRLTRTFNGAGTFTATLTPVADKAALWASATITERTIVYIERDGVLLDGIIIWKRKRKSGQPWELEGANIASLLRRNRIVTDLSYTATDQFTIARALVSAMQSQTGGNVGINVGSGTCGVTRDRTYYAYERKNIGDALSELGNVNNGFDWAIEVAWEAGVPAKNLVLSYPRRGRIAGSTGLVFESGKNLLDYDFTEDGTRSARAVDTLGSGDGADMLISTAARTDLLDAGWPLTAETRAYKDVKVQATLDNHATAAVNARANTPTLLTVRVDPDDVDAGLGHFIDGDDVDVRITDDSFPAASDGSPGHRAFYRVISHTLNMGDHETLDVELGGID